MLLALSSASGGGLGIRLLWLRAVGGVVTSNEGGGVGVLPFP